MRWQGAVAALGMMLIPTALRGNDFDRCVVGPPQPVFRAEAGVDTEGVAVAPDGEVFTADWGSGTIYRIRHDGKSEVFTTLFSPGEYPFVSVLGMTFGPDRNLYVVANTWDPVTHGVWRVHRDGFVELAVAIPTEGSLNGQTVSSFLNGLTFDDHGNLFVTDSTLGAIWKTSRCGGKARLWLQSDLLIWKDDPTGPFGANGIAYSRGALYVAVTDAGPGLLPELRGSNYPVVRVPIRREGSAGTPSVFFTDILVPDGLAADRAGNLYVVDFGGLAWGPGFPNTGPARLVRVRPDGTGEVLASQGLENSASVAIRGQTAYVTNLFVQNTANVVKIDLCTKKPHER